MRTAAFLLASLALLAAPAVSPAQQNPFAPLPPSSQSGETPTVVVQPPKPGEDGLKSWQEVLIFGSGLILIFGIGWAIVSDARSKAPVKDADLSHPGTSGPVKTNRSAKQKQRDRAKAKQGRAQRRKARGR
jgi:hypothetical protein